MELELKEEQKEQSEDIQWVAAAQAGDSRAFDKLIIKYSPRLYSMLYNMTSNREDANDLMLESFTKAYRSLKYFRSQSRFYTWVYAIAANLAINHLKRSKRKKTLSLDELDANAFNSPAFVASDTDSDPICGMERKEVQKKLNEAMQELSEDHRIVVTLFDIQDLAHAEIAQILGISEGTIRSRLHYAHKHLQSLLGDFLK